MKKSPYMNLGRIEFIVTYNCTGKCIHCSVAGTEKGAKQFQHIKKEEAAETVGALAGIFPISSVMTFGGEPLLYPDVTCAIHKSAADCGIETRQIITNGYFSKEEERMRETVHRLKSSGVNNLLLSVDAFHQQTIPAETVRFFAGQICENGIESFKLHPAWLVNREHKNPYNDETEAILKSFSPLNIPISNGNDIFPAGNAAKYLSEYYPKSHLDLSARCGTMPYTSPLTDVRSLSVEPNGDVTVCSFVIGNIYREGIEEIVSRYDPNENEYMRTLISGGGGELMKIAVKNGIDVDMGKCRTVCGLCRSISRQLR